MDSADDSPEAEGPPSAPRHASNAVELRPSRWARPEFFFLPAFLIVGAIFIAWVPAGWNADEPGHTYRAFQIAEGHPLPTVKTTPEGATTVGGEVPNDVVALFNLTKALGGDVFDPSAKVDHLFTAAQEQAAHPSGDQFVDFRNTALYSPVAYAPGIVAIWAGRAAGLEPMSIVELARTLSLLTVGIAWTVAIRIIPRGKWTMAAVGLLPSVVSQSAALSADGMVLAVSSLFVAAWAYCLLRPGPPTRRAYVAITALAVLLGLCKVAYAPMALLVVAIPLVHRSGSRLRSLGPAALMLAVSWAPAVAWSFVTRAANVSLNATADVHQQTAWIEHHPWGFVEVLYKTFLGRPSDGLALSVFGNFIWLSAGIPALYVLFGAASLATSRYVSDAREVRALPAAAAIWVGLWALAVAIATSLVISLGIYVTFVPVGSSFIAGLTGRYFLPPLLVALVAFSGNRLTSQSPARWTVLLTSAALLIGGLLTLHHRLFA